MKKLIIVSIIFLCIISVRAQLITSGSGYDDRWIRRNLSSLNGDEGHMSIGWNNTITTWDTIMIGANHKTITGTNQILLGIGCLGYDKYPVQLCNGQDAVFIPTISSIHYEGGDYIGTTITTNEVNTYQYYVTDMNYVIHDIIKYDDTLNAISIGNIADRIIINGKNIHIGEGNQYVCMDNEGVLYTSHDPCN